MKSKRKRVSPLVEELVDDAVWLRRKSFPALRKCFIKDNNEFAEGPKITGLDRISHMEESAQTFMNAYFDIRPPIAFVEPNLAEVQLEIDLYDDDGLNFEYDVKPYGHRGVMVIGKPLEEELEEGLYNFVVNNFRSSPEFAFTVGQTDSYLNAATAFLYATNVLASRLRQREFSREEYFSHPANFGFCNEVVMSAIANYAVVAEIINFNRRAIAESLVEEDCDNDDVEETDEQYGTIISPFANDYDDLEPWHLEHLVAEKTDEANDLAQNIVFGYKDHSLDAIETMLTVSSVKDSCIEACMRVADHTFDRIYSLFNKGIHGKNLLFYLGFIPSELDPKSEKASIFSNYVHDLDSVLND